MATGRRSSSGRKNRRTPSEVWPVMPPSGAFISGVTRDDVERPAIRDPALLPVVAPQALGDHLLGGRVTRVVDGEDGRLHRPLARSVTRRPALDAVSNG